MLDRYIWGRASRLSQEAPVPVIHVRRESNAPGGAANVVRNILSLGGEASAFGVLGDDAHGRTLCESLLETGADLSGVLFDPDRPTTVKTRVIAGNQQVVRIDREELEPLAEKTAAKVVENVCKAVASGRIDAVILEDYAKGVLSIDAVATIVNCCAEKSVPVALDPHPSHAFNTPGLHLITPNRAEAFALAGQYYHSGSLPPLEDETLLETGRRLLDLWQCDQLLMTLGGDGMALFRQNAPPVHIPTQAREVFDVSGAGDTVMAAFVLASLADASPEQAAAIANYAAGIVVAEVGTATVSARELAEMIANDGKRALRCPVPDGSGETP